MASNETFTYGIQITSDSSGAIKDFKAGGNSAEKFAKSLSDLDKKSGKAGKQFKKSSKEVGGLQKGFREAAASAALLEGPLGGVAGRLSAMGAIAGRSNVALAGIGLGFAAAAFLAKKSISAYAETEHQLARLNSQLELTGHVSGFTTTQLDLMARSIARNTLASTEDMRDAISVMLTFTSVTGDVFEDAIVASNNLAQVMGGSVKAAAVQLGKALEDPRVGLTALRRSGVSFTTEQRGLIISLVDAGRKSEAMAEALKVLNSQLPDASKGVGALKGNFDSLGQSVGEFLETFAQFSGLDKIVAGWAFSLTQAADAMKGVVDPELDADLNSLLTKRLDLMMRIGKEGRKQGGDTLSKEARALEVQIATLLEKQNKSNEKIASGAAKRQQIELEERNKILISNGIKQGVIRTRTAQQTGSLITKIQTQQLNQRLADELITVDHHNKELTNLKLQQNQREIDALKDMRLQLENEEATPIVKFRADENIKRKEIERQFIIKQGVVDLAIARKKAADEREKQDAKVSARQQAAEKSLQSARIALLKSSGGQAEAAQLEITARYKTMLDNLSGQSQIAGQEIVNKLIAKEKLKISLTAMKKQVDDALDAMGNRERSIGISVDTGLLTEIEGRQAVLDIHKETAVVLDTVAKKMEAVARVSGDSKALNGVESLKNKVRELSSEATVLETQVRDGLSVAFSSVFTGIGRDINSAEDALKAFTLSILDSIAQIAAQEAAEQATSLAVKGIGALVGSFHTGGDNLTGRDGKKMQVAPALFQSAPRFHSGLQSDEFPAILQTGEDVVARNDPRNSRFGGGANKTTTINITVPVSIDSDENDQKRAQGISKLIKTTVTRELVKEKRPGGLLA